MNSKVEAALKIFPLCSWSNRVFKRRSRFAAHVVGSNTWPGFATLWDPLENWHGNFYSILFRARGRPQKRCDDILRQFCQHIYGNDCWFGHARQHAAWFPLNTRICNVLPGAFFVVVCLFSPVS